MLSEILEAYAPIMEKGRKPHAPGLSMSGLFPCPYRLYLAHTGQMYKGREWTSQQLWNLADGWDQEEQSVRRLKQAGVEIIDRQIHLTIGKSKVPGSPDGAFVLNGRKYLWMEKQMNIW